MRSNRTKLQAALLLFSLLTIVWIPPGSASAREPIDRSQEIQQEAGVVPVWMTSMLDWLSGLVGMTGVSAGSSLCVDPGCDPGTTTGTTEPTGGAPIPTGDGGITGSGEEGGQLDPEG